MLSRPSSTTWRPDVEGVIGVLCEAQGRPLAGLFGQLRTIRPQGAPTARQRGRSCLLTAARTITEGGSVRPGKYID